MAVSTSALPARHFDAALAHEAIAARADREMFLLRALCRKIGITPELIRQWSAEDPDPQY